MINPAQKLRYGFTLIELLIVIAIIGILAAAVLIAVNPAKRQNQAKDSQIKSDIGSIATALQAYYTQPGEGTYPTTAQGLAILVTNQDLKQLPTPPTGSSTAAYQYIAFPNSPACDNTAGNECIETVVYADLLDAAVGEVWCYESVTGKAQKISVAANCDNSAATL